MANPDVNYNALANEGNPFNVEMQSPLDDPGATDTENEETPRNSGIMIHVVPDTSKSRWNHIENLDSFFARMYSYHQKHGFYVMMLQEVFELFQFVFVVVFTTFLFHCVNYPVLFKEVQLNHTKVTLNDAIYPVGECVDTFSGFTWFSLLMSFLFWGLRLIKVLYHIVQYWDIKKFFNTALKIEDSELDNLTWHEVQKRVREVQSEQQMCIHKEQLTELDIYHRILRFKNYMVAMMNKSLLPAKTYLPFIGECVCFSRGLRYNIELILFWGPWSPFENNWHLREEFKRSNKRAELASKLSRQIMWVALANAVLFPLIFLWQLMYLFFNYADLIKREPSVLGARCWSHYGQLYLRHFNELDHELYSRLNRAYRPAVKYMNSFSSPLMAVIGRNMCFFGGGILSVLILLTVIDEDVVQVENVLTIMTILTMLVVISRTFIPDENLIWCPEQLLTAVLAHVHYLPSQWRGLAHTSNVREQFGQFFQLRAIYLINELVSPLVTPFVLLFTLRPRALDLVDFFRNFTVSVVGVGDVCSFAQMDVRKHGNPEWHLTPSGIEINAGDTEDGDDELSPACTTNQYTQGENGKTELSLVHFTLTNPGWKMPADAKHFVHGIKKHALNDMNRARGAGVLPNTTAMGQSLLSVGSLGAEYSSIVQSIFQNPHVNGDGQGISIFQHQQNSQNPFSTLSSLSHFPPESLNMQPGFDFSRMLQQNMSDNFSGASGMPPRSTYLHDIREDEDGTATAATNAAATASTGSIQQESSQNFASTFSNIRSTRGPSVMGGSIRGGIAKREGPLEASGDGFLQSLCGETSMLTDYAPYELTTADMCLSTLYLHELYHRKARRRGVRLEQSQRHLWQRPHQHPPTVATTTVQQHPRATSTSFSHSPMPGTSGGTSASMPAEKTPLLGSKKS